jgi:hypothetical protein
MVSHMATENQSEKYIEGDYIIHKGLRRVAIFKRLLGSNGARIKLLTGEHMLIEMVNMRHATKHEREAAVKDIWHKIDAENAFDGDALAKLRERVMK